MMLSEDCLDALTQGGTQQIARKDVSVHALSNAEWRSLCSWVLLGSYRCLTCSVDLQRSEKVTRTKGGGYICATCRPFHTAPLGKDRVGNLACSGVYVYGCTSCQGELERWTDHLNQIGAAERYSAVMKEAREKNLLTVAEAAIVAKVGHREMNSLIFQGNIETIRTSPHDYLVPVDAAARIAGYTIQSTESFERQQIAILRAMIDVLANRLNRLEDQFLVLQKQYGVRRTPLSATQRQRIISRDLSRCRYCGARVPKHLIHIDHIIPVAMGGKAIDDNLVTSCQRCNREKGAMSLVDTKLTLRPAPFTSGSMQPPVPTGADA